MKETKSEHLDLFNRAANEWEASRRVETRCVGRGWEGVLRAEYMHVHPVPSIFI
jgi:hypothetical protein